MGTSLREQLWEGERGRERGETEGGRERARERQGQRLEIKWTMNGQ